MNTQVGPMLTVIHQFQFSSSLTTAEIFIIQPKNNIIQKIYTCMAMTVRNMNTQVEMWLMTTIAFLTIKNQNTNNLRAINQSLNQNRSIRKNLEKTR